MITEEQVMEGVLKLEKKSLLKRKSPSNATIVLAPDPVRPVDAVLVEDVNIEAVPPVSCTTDYSPPSEPISLISDDDDFEVVPSKPKKATPLSYKKRGT